MVEKIESNFVILLLEAHSSVSVNLATLRAGWVVFFFHGIQRSLRPVHITVINKKNGFF
jgi:hypothetical protein